MTKEEIERLKTTVDSGLAVHCVAMALEPKVESVENGNAYFERASCINLSRDHWYLDHFKILTDIP